MNASKPIPWRQIRRELDEIGRRLESVHNQITAGLARRGPPPGIDGQAIVADIAHVRFWLRHITGDCERAAAAAALAHDSEAPS